MEPEEFSELSGIGVKSLNDTIEMFQKSIRIPNFLDINYF